jgi:hypothetical protein
MCWGSDLSSCAENKFAVGSGAKTVCVCYYEEDNNWYLLPPLVENCLFVCFVLFFLFFLFLGFDIR